MNLLKKGPFFLFQLVFALITVILCMILVLFFTRKDLAKYFSKQDAFPADEEKVVEIDRATEFAGPTRFGVIHVMVDSPSYAQSNFDVNPETSLEIYFNEVISVENLKEHIKLANSANGELREFALADFVREDFTLGENSKSWEKYWKHKITIKPLVSLDPASNYTLLVSAGVASKDLSLRTLNSFKYDLTTAAIPGVHSTNLGEEGELQKGSALTITFTVPMETVSLEENISLSPQVSTLNLANNDKVFTLEADFVKGYTYTLLIPGNTVDIYGRELGEDFFVDFYLE